jgi:hypothetical protein
MNPPFVAIGCYSQDVIQELFLITVLMSLVESGKKQSHTDRR